MNSVSTRFTGHHSYKANITARAWPVLYEEFNPPPDSQRPAVEEVGIEFEPNANGGVGLTFWTDPQGGHLSYVKSTRPDKLYIVKRFKADA